jgi:phosphoribosylamine--glycine ligase
MKKQSILVVGSGGREHTIVWKLAQSERVGKLYCAPGNGGIADLAECVPINVMDKTAMVSFAKENKIDLTVVAPDDPLADGMVDAFEAAGLRVFGPNAAAAEIEGSKAFSKDLMKKYHIPTAGYEVFTDYTKACNYLEKVSYPTVVKADGLALGKGVIIAQTKEEALTAVDDMMNQSKFGAAGTKVVIEEFMTGPEVSILTFVDGKTVVPMISSQDHKRALDNDEGLNTGGMGTFAPSPKYTDEVKAFAEANILQKTVDAMAQEGRPFKGVLYFGLMLTPEGPKVLEYNARFGDPETQVVLPLMKSDLLDVFDAVIDEKLDKISIEWLDKAAVCVIQASGGYPVVYEKGYEITGLEEMKQYADYMVFHAGTTMKENKIVTNGGRVLGITAIADNLESAIKKAYNKIDVVTFKDVHYRTDIGRK